MAELADALDSKSGIREDVWVRPPPSAPSRSRIYFFVVGLNVLVPLASFVGYTEGLHFETNVVFFLTFYREQWTFRLIYRLLQKLLCLKKLFVGVVNVHRHSAPTWASKTSLLTLKLFVSSIWITRRSAPQVNKPFPTWGRLVSCLGLVLLAFDFSSQVLAQTQIVNCDAPVQSRKRGIAVNSTCRLRTSRPWRREYRGFTIGA